MRKRWRVRNSFHNQSPGGTATYKPEVTGGKPPYNFSIGDGTSLPSGFNMGPDGTIGGGGTPAPVFIVF